MLTVLAFPTAEITEIRKDGATKGPDHAGEIPRQESERRYTDVPRRAKGIVDDRVTARSLSASTVSIATASQGFQRICRPCSDGLEH